MIAAFSPTSAINDPTMMSCPGETARKNGIRGKYISSVGHVTSW
jgi:hypothetical protein